MEELNFKEEELKGFKEFNKGGYEGKILLYKPEILLKRFEPFIMPFLNMPTKNKVMKYHMNFLIDYTQ